MKYIILTLSLLFTMNMVAAQDAYQVENYQVVFFIDNAGITVEGSMEGLEADVAFHPRKIAQTRIVATLDPATIRTGIRIRDNHLKRSDYFDIEQYPKITLTSTGFTKNGKDALLGIFILNIKGMEREVKIPITYTNSGDILDLSGNFIINRLDFGLGEESFILSDDVSIEITAQFRREKS